MLFRTSTCDSAVLPLCKLRGSLLKRSLSLSLRLNYSPVEERGLFQLPDFQSPLLKEKKKISRILFPQANDLLLWLLGAAWGMKGRVSVADTKGRVLCVQEAKWPCCHNYRRIPSAQSQSLPHKHSPGQQLRGGDGRP